MQKYDYRKAMLADIAEWFSENGEIVKEAEEVAEAHAAKVQKKKKLTPEQTAEIFRDNLAESISAHLWDYDGVTGNGSGAYYPNSAQSLEAVNGNWFLAGEAFEAFDALSENPFKRGPDYVDVSIRCYLLDSVLSEYIKANFRNFL